MFIGFLMYRSGIYVNLGNLYWKNGGSKFWRSSQSLNKSFDNLIDNVWNKLMLINNSIEHSISSIEHSISSTGKNIRHIYGGIGGIVRSLPKKIWQSKPKDPKADFEDRVIKDRDRND